REFAMHSPEDYVRIFMVEGLGVRTVVLGEDALVGSANAGTIDTMRELGRRYDFEVLTVADLGPEGTDGGRMSASDISEAVLQGDERDAAGTRGRSRTGTEVDHGGHQLGRELGVPTANLGPDPAGLVPADAVYAADLTVVEQYPEYADLPP